MACKGDNVIVVVVVAKSAVESGDMSPVVQSSMMLGKVTLLMLKDSGKLRVPWMTSDAGERFEFSVSTCAKGFRRQMLPVPAGRNACCALKRSSDSWVRSPVSRPHNEAVMNTLLPEFSDFILVMRKFTIKCRLREHLRELPLQRRRPHTHRAALRLGTPPRFRCYARVCQFLARIVSSRGFGVAACVFQLRVHEGRNNNNTGQLPPKLCWRVFSEHW